MKQGQAETVLLIQYGHEMDLGEAIPEYRFAREVGRQFRADLAWPASRLLVEIEGGSWLLHGHHGYGDAFESDCAKYNYANLLGYTLLRFTYRMIRDGRAHQFMKQFAERKGMNGKG